MKSKSTIEKQIRRIRKLIDSVDDPILRREWFYRAYDVEQALRWVLFDRCTWSPAGLVEDEEKVTRRAKSEGTKR